MTVYPRGMGPPVHFPFRRAAAILSLVLSPIISRSNSAKDMSMLSVRRPMASAVEKFWVTETKEAPDRLKRSISFAKSRSERLRRSTL